MTSQDSQPVPGSVSPLRIVLADDHALFRGGLVLLIKMMDTPVEVIEANDLDQVLELLSGGASVDLLLLDLMMPGMNGLEGLRRICQTWPDVPVVVVSVKEETQVIRDAMRSGAMGYIPKTSSPEVTTNALKFILAGGIYIPPHVLDISDTPSVSQSDLEMAPGTRLREGRVQDQIGNKDQIGDMGQNPDENSDTNPDTNRYGLTARQLEVLRLMSTGRSNKDIAADLDISAGTVKMHVSRIFKVLNVSNRTQAASKLNDVN